MALKVPFFACGGSIFPYPSSRIFYDVPLNPFFFPVCLDMSWVPFFRKFFAGICMVHFYAHVCSNVICYILLDIDMFFVSGSDM